MDLKQVSADAKWGADLDIDALHASSTFQKAREQFLKMHPEAEVIMAGVREVWKFDPRTDLHGITLYGVQVKKDTGVAIVHAKVDKDLLLEKVKQAPGHSETTYGKYELHIWTHAKGSHHERAMTGTFYTPDMLVFGASVDEVKAALDVLDGAKPNMADKKPMTFSPGTIFCAGISGVAEADLPHKMPLAKKIDSVMVEIGENQGEVFVHGHVAAKEAENAQQFKSVIDGALAFATLMHGDDPETKKLIDAAKVTLADKNITLEWQAPVDAVVAQAQKACAARCADKSGARHGILFDSHP